VDHYPYDDDFELDELSLYSGEADQVSTVPSWPGRGEEGPARQDSGEDQAVPHLPAITTSRTDPQQHVVKAPLFKENLRHYNHHIRGVGSYRVARETTFEITGADYDIRYRDVITCQKGDRETPPPDIFQRSVGKVRDWLNKHYVARGHNS
jgi:hypothetical protein